MIGTFGLTTFAWIFFRADSISNAGAYIKGLFSPSLLHTPVAFPGPVLIALAFFICMEWIGREQPYAIAGLGLRWPRPARWAFYYLLIFAIFKIASETKPFIYFQF
jgi:hypothetical protein